MPVPELLDDELEPDEFVPLLVLLLVVELFVVLPLFPLLSVFSEFVFSPLASVLVFPVLPVELPELLSEELSLSDSVMESSISAVGEFTTSVLFQVS